MDVVLVFDGLQFGDIVMRRGSGGGGGGSGGGCGWGGGMLGRWSLRRLLLDSPLVGRRLAHTGLCSPSTTNTERECAFIERSRFCNT